jgi:hypothetical protein
MRHGNRFTVLAVNHNTPDFMRLLVAPTRKFSEEDHVIIIFDNDSKDGSREWLETQTNIRSIYSSTNIGHGLGLDQAFPFVETPWTCVLDIDCHVQRPGWDGALRGLYTRSSKTRLVAAHGGVGNEQKPIHPFFMWFETSYFRQQNFKFAPGNGWDVGRALYGQILERGYEVVRVQSGYEPGGGKFYPGVFGTEYYIDGQPTIYHNWYSARMTGLKLGDDVDGYKYQDFMAQKKLLFSQPLVRDILGNKAEESDV